MRLRLAVSVGLSLAGLAGIPGTGTAQLISPGKLSAAHRELDGIRQCSKCHSLRTRGASAAKCLACHRPLKARIDAERGLHAGFTGRECSECHKEHFGRDFGLVRFDTASFDHRDTGFGLAGSHAAVSCGKCHAEERIMDPEVRTFVGQGGARHRTFLGLDESCVSCHREDDPHEDQFAGRACDACHTAEDWKRPERFDHSKTRFALLGRHKEVGCNDCHRPGPGHRTGNFRYELKHASCTSCHREDDPHEGRFTGRDCASCHTESGWNPPSRFRHSRTRFVLTGRHRRVSCDACHRPGRGGGTNRFRYALQFKNCTSCHSDPHESALGTSCESCHTTAGWHRLDRSTLEGSFDHKAVGFELVGRHADLECAACHGERSARSSGIRIRYLPETRGRQYPRPQGTDCLSCHVDRHRGAFARAPGGATCDNCHGQQGWEPTTYDIGRHNRQTSFALLGSHLATPCAACHRVRRGEAWKFRFRLAELKCESCHAKDDPHAGQLAGRPCAECHESGSFRVAHFDHTTTRFPLEGSHRTVKCVACHRRDFPSSRGPTIRFKPVGIRCSDCH